MNGPTFTTHAASPAAAPKPATAAPPRPAGPARPGAKPDPDAGGGMRVFTYLRLHWLMILFCGTLLGGAGAYAAWELLPSKFESYALLQVSSAPFTLANQSGPTAPKTDFVTYLKTAAAQLKSELVLNAAIRDDRLHELPTLKDQKDPIKFLEEEVLVNWQDGSEVIRITFKGHNPTDVKRVVDSVQQAFMKNIVQADVNRIRGYWLKVSEAMSEVKRIVEQKIPDKAARGGPAVTLPPVGAAGALPPLTPGAPPNPAAPPAGPAAGPSDAVLLQYDPLIPIRQYLSLKADVEKLPTQINDMKRRIETVKDKLEHLAKEPPPDTTFAAVDRDPEVLKKAIDRNHYKSQYESWARVGKPQSEGAQTYYRLWQAREQDLAKLRHEKVVALEKTRKDELAKKIIDEGNGFKNELMRLEEQLADAKARMTKVQEEVAKLPPPEKTSGDRKLGPDYNPAISDLEMTDGIYRRLIAQYHLTKLELDSPERVRVLQPASQPIQKDTRKQVLATVFAGLMGYVIIALGVVAFETMSRRVSSLADLKAAGPAPVVGVIPCQPAEATGRDPVKRAAANEAIDKLRAYVAQTWLARGATTVAVTSPLGDEGKAFVAFGLASSLAQAGYRTLLVDFDLREPALHTYAGILNQDGICEILRGESDVRGALQQLPSGLHLVPAGKWSDEARKAAVGGKLEALLGRLREPYDCVVIHAHALLTVAETVEVARRCEVVLVSARYRESKVPLVKLATDRVAAMEIPFSGVVYVGATEREALC